MKKLIAVFLMITLALTLAPISFAAHAHDGSCGYKAASPCRHDHDRSCGYLPSTPCTCGNPDNHTGSCDYSTGEPCQHSHNGSCGYSAGSPCTYVEPHTCNYGLFESRGDGTHVAICTLNINHQIIEGCYSDNNNNHKCDHCAQPMSEHEFTYTPDGDSTHVKGCYCGEEVTEDCVFDTVPEGRENVRTCVCGNEQAVSQPSSGDSDNDTNGLPAPSSHRDINQNDLSTHMEQSGYEIFSPRITEGRSNISWGQDEYDELSNTPTGLLINASHVSALISAQTVAAAGNGLEFNYEENEQGFSASLSDGEVPIADLKVSYGTQTDFTDQFVVWTPRASDDEPDIPKDVIVVPAHTGSYVELDDEAVAALSALYEASAAEDEARKALSTAETALREARLKLQALKEKAAQEASAKAALEAAQAEYNAFAEAAANMTDEAKDNNIHRAREEWLKNKVDEAETEHRLTVEAQNLIEQQEELVRELTEKASQAKAALEAAIIKHTEALLNFESLGYGYAFSRDFSAPEYSFDSVSSLEVLPVSTYTILDTWS